MEQSSSTNVFVKIMALFLGIPLGTCLLITLLLAVVLLVLWPKTKSTTPGVCTHWASPTGTGSLCTESSPCTISTWTQSTSLAQAGRTLCLMDGTYRLSQGGNIDPLDTIAGTSSQPITVRAINDGQVTIDAEHNGFAVFLQADNNYWHIEGVNGTNGKEAVFRSRASHIRFVRIIAYNGTEGQADSLGISMSGPGVDQLCIDCAAWGSNMRKMISFTQSEAPNQDMLGSGCRRCWGEWNDHPEGMSKPNNVYQGGYRSRGQIWENIIGTWRETGTVGDAEGIVRMFYGCQESNMVSNLRLVGSLFYLQNVATARLGQLATADCGSQITFRDVAALVSSDHTNVKPFLFRSSSGSVTPEENNVCENCLGVHAGTPSVNQNGSGWTMPGFREGRTLDEATNGQSIYDLLPGLCYKYENGILTNKPLWPWDMEQRIKAARIASGAPEVSVTNTVEQLLGSIPDKCRSDRQPPQPPTVNTLNCTGELGAQGKITMTCKGS